MRPEVIVIYDDDDEVDAHATDSETRDSWECSGSSTPGEESDLSSVKEISSPASVTRPGSSASSSEESGFSMGNKHTTPSSVGKRGSSSDDDPVSLKKRRLSKPQQPMEHVGPSLGNSQKMEVYTVKFFRDMANTITEVFPVTTFADQHRCTNEDVSRAIDGVVIGPLTMPKYMDFEPEPERNMTVPAYGKMMIDRWTEVGEKAKDRCVTGTSRAAVPVARVAVRRDEYGSYVRVEEDDQEKKDDEERRGVYERRRQRRQYGDLQATLIDDE